MNRLLVLEQAAYEAQALFVGYNEEISRLEKIIEGMALVTKDASGKIQLVAVKQQLITEQQKTTADRMEKVNTNIRSVTSKPTPVVVKVLERAGYFILGYIISQGINKL